MEGAHGNGSDAEPARPNSDTTTTPKPATRRTKSRSKVWERVSWFKKRNRSTDNVGEASGSSAVTSPRVSGQSDEQSSSLDMDFSPSTSTSSCSPVRCPSLGSTSSSELDLFDTHHTDNLFVKRSKLYPNSEIVEQSCLRPSIARALFQQLESWLSRKDDPSSSKYSQKTAWPKKKRACEGNSVADSSGMTRTVSMPGGILTQSKCHCAACCSCSPRDRLEGTCSVYAKLSTSTTSLDTGLATLGFSSAYNPLIQNPPPQSVHSETDSSSSICVSNQSPIVAAKCSSLPGHGSATKHKTCAVCDKLLSLAPMTTCDIHPPSTNTPSTSTTSHQPTLPELNFCQCQHQPCSVKHERDSIHCQVHKDPSTCPGHRITVESLSPLEPVEESTSWQHQSQIGPSEFKERVDLIKQWFSEFNDEQKNLVLKQLLDDSDLPQLHMLSIEMEPRLHASCPPNCHDRLSWLPQALFLHIMSYLDPVSLCQASAVTRSWYQIATEPNLWRRFCGQPKWRLSRAGEGKQLLHHMMADGTIQWKRVFADRYRLRNNWLKGRCNVRTFEGHTQGISCVQFDDTRIVSGSSDKTIKVWNIRTNNPWAVQTLAGHSGTVRCLHLDGNRLVSGSTDRTIKVWDLSTQQSWSSIACKVTMVGHTDTVRCLQVDEEKVVSGSYDKTLKVWDMKTGSCKMTLRGHTAAVLCAQFDATKIVSGSCDKTIKVWAFDGQCMMTLEGHRDAVTCLQFDTTRIFSGSLDCNLMFWDINTGHCMNTIDWKASEGHTGVVRCLQADSWRVVSASDDRTLKVWSLETGQRLVTLRNHTDGVTCLQFNDSIIVSGSYDKTVKLWDFSCC